MKERAREMTFSVRSLGKQVFNVAFQRLTKHIVFLHIPKCGGISIESAIKRHTRFSHVRIAPDATFKAATVNYQLQDPEVKQLDTVLRLREDVLAYFMSRKIHFISGHLCFNERTYRHFHERYHYITILRDPVERWISSYFFNRYKTSDQHFGIQENISTFLQSERAKAMGYCCVRMLGGLHQSGDYVSQQAITRAKENLHKFEIVECLEYIEDFTKQFKQRFGVKLKLRRKNQNPKTQAFIQSMITKEIEGQIIRLCQPDIEVYNYAVQNVVKKH